MTFKPLPCGLDFGTSNSSIGRLVDGRPRLLAIEDGRVSMPTAIFFSFEDGAAHFGRAAIERYLAREEGRLMRALKSVLGSSLIHDTTMLKGRRLRFLDIIAMLVRFAREAAGGPTSVVLGRPVRFVDGDEAADRDAESQLRAAAELAGFESIEFQLEPIAAALDYEQRIAKEQLAFVVDIGGGTSDFSIVRVAPERRGRTDRRSDILGTGGIRVGGTDFDRLLDLATVMPHLGLGSRLREKHMEPPVWWFHDLATWSRINFMYDQKVAAEIRRVRRDALEPAKFDRLLGLIEARKGHAMLAAVEQAKIDLSGRDRATLGLTGIGMAEEHVLGRGDLEAAIGDAVGRVMARLADTLRSAGIAAEAIDAVFLTGGSSRVPMLRREVEARFPGAAMIEGDTFGSVAAGLAIDAHNRFR